MISGAGRGRIHRDKSVALCQVEVREFDYGVYGPPPAVRTRASPFVSLLPEIKGIDQTLTYFATVERATDVRLRARARETIVPQERIFDSNRQI